MCLQRGLYLQIHHDAMHVVCKATYHMGQKTHLLSSSRGSSRSKYFKLHLAQIKPIRPSRIGKAPSFFPTLQLKEWGWNHHLQHQVVSETRAPVHVLWGWPFSFSVAPFPSVLLVGPSLSWNRLFCITACSSLARGFFIKFGSWILVMFFYKFHAFWRCIKQIGRPHSWCSFWWIYGWHQSHVLQAFFVRIYKIQTVFKVPENERKQRT